MNIFEQVRHEFKAGRYRSAIHLARKHGWERNIGDIIFEFSGDVVVLYPRYLTKAFDLRRATLYVMRAESFKLNTAPSLDSATSIHVQEGGASCDFVRISTITRRTLSYGTIRSLRQFV